MVRAAQQAPGMVVAALAAQRAPGVAARAALRGLEAVVQAAGEREPARHDNRS